MEIDAATLNSNEFKYLKKLPSVDGNPLNMHRSSAGQVIRLNSELKPDFHEFSRLPNLPLRICIKTCHFISKPVTISANNGCYTTFSIALKSKSELEIYMVQKCRSFRHYSCVVYMFIQGE